MPYLVTVNYPNLPKDESVLIDGLGEFKNGAETEVSDENEAIFNALQGRSLKAAFIKSKRVTVKEKK